MRAIVVDSTASNLLRFAEADEPTPTAGQVILGVHHASINHGDRVRAALEKAGTILGMDASGVVLRAAENGSGPAVGERVACFGLSTWAERMAVDVDRVARVPESVDLADAAALATAGVTALRALRAAGSVLGRVVLVTGAAGGVGRYAVQLAALAGAHVVASVSSAARAEGLEALGAHEVVVGVEGIAGTRFPVDVVIENVGGPHLVAAFQRLSPGGNIQSVGWASGEPAAFPPYGLFAFGAERTLTDASGIMFDRPHVGRDLEILLGNLRAGRLSAQIGWRGPWEQHGEAIAALASRRIAGKGVLDVRS